MSGEKIQSNQERERPDILRHCNKRPIVHGLGDEGNPEHRDNPHESAWDCQQVNLNRLESEVFAV
jgi:hypothetical protein